MWLLLLTACIENKLTSGDDGTTPFETGEVLDSGDSADSEHTPVEECDGDDDDGDGEIDEGFPDVDGDGVADCVDGACTLDTPAPVSSTREDCEGSGGGAPPARPWEVAIEWRHLGGNVLNTPAVGDLDGDGVPEVVASEETGGGGQTVVLDGATGTVELILPATDPWSGVALGDLDGDGMGEIVVTEGSYSSNHSVAAYDTAGLRLWRTTIDQAGETHPALADLDGDGTVEVLVNEYVLDGATGSVERVFPQRWPENWGAVTAADMDQDGDQEVLLANRVYDLDGNVLLTCGYADEGTFPHPVQLDDDEAGELVVAAYRGLTACDDDGTELWSKDYSSYGSAMTVADFDDDGEMEIAFAKTSTVTLFDRDGSVLWTAGVTDNSGLAGCTNWDVDLDGVPEVVYADEQQLWVLDGRTGEARVQDRNHTSRTASETPAVADVDGDGHGEIIVPNDNGTYSGITVLGSADGDWPYARPVYNQASYYGENVRDDLSIPATPDAPWVAAPNLFRGQPSAVWAAGDPNLSVSITDLCVASCEAEGRVSAWVQVANDGGADVAAVTLRLEGTVDGVPVEIERRVLGPVAAGGSVETRVDLSRAQVGDGLVATLDPEGEIVECVDGARVDTWMDLGCP